jgi:nucleotide-binding universal stress UspA family protein
MIRISKILVPVDFSNGSTAATQFANEIAGYWGAKVDLIHIVPVLKYLNDSIIRLGLPLDMDKDLYPRIVSEIQEKLQFEMRDRISESNRGEAFVITGRKASEEIVERGRENGYDLIVLGSHGSHNHFLHGSVAEHVVRMSQVAVLTVPPETKPHGFTNIVLPTDGSDRSFAILPFAIQLAHSFRSKVTLLHVLELYGTIAEDVYIYTGETEIDSIKGELIRKIEKFFWHRYGRDIAIVEETDDGMIINWKEGEKQYRTEFLLDIYKSVSAYLEIVDYSNQNADMVAMTTHGRTGLAHVLLGSTTERVVRHAKVPVLTFRPELNNK